MSDLNSKKIKGIECRFAVHCKSPKDISANEDLHLIKEVVTFEDGTQKPRVVLRQGYKRPFYLTKKGRRNHQDYKEWEELSNLDRYESTQSALTDSIARAMEMPYFRGTLRDLCEKPYIYGADVSSTSLIKNEYRQKYPNQISPFTLAAFDTETDMVHGHGQIMIAGITFKERIYVAIQSDFLSGYVNQIERLHETTQKYLGDLLKQRNAQVTFELFPTEIDVVKAVMAKAHAWSPDWLALWNMEFDVEKIIEACRRADVPIEDILSDPIVPKSFRHFRFKKGLAKKVMSSGRVLNFKPSQRWHTVFCPSGFYWIDAMCAYRQVRQGAPEEPSYSLDDLLKANELGGKLKFKEAEHVEEDPDQWHRFMQSRFPFEYVVYNIYDCIGIELLDEKNKDLQMALPDFARMSDFSEFNSQPKRLVNDLHYFCLDRNKVVGTTGSELVSDLDESTTDINGWIVMLPSHSVADNGLKIVLENDLLPTNIRGGVADLDVAGAYPTNQKVMNVSKQTTRRELIEVEGVDWQTMRYMTINFSAGPTNAVEWCTTVYKMPALDGLLEAFKRDQACGALPIENGSRN